MTGPVSVIVLNRDRPLSLARTLLALSQQTYHPFEVVVVTNQPAAIAKFPGAARARIVSCPEANVAKARNLGIAQAAGEIIAFCDDDAVPEPTWLAELLRPFADKAVGATGGLVRGRNGVSLQWGFQEVDSFGNDWPVPTPAQRRVTAPTPGRVLKTVGTNCAFRRAALAEIGGFDEAYRFFLDETDANWRLAAAGWKIVGVPGAEVHHMLMGSALRSSERVPKSFLQIAASKVHFCQKFGDPSRISEELDGFRAAARRRLIRFHSLGLLSPAQIEPLMISLEEGYLKGARRSAILHGLAPASQPFAPFTDGAPSDSLFLSGRGFLRKDLQRAARAMAANRAAIVTLLLVDASARPLTVRFSEDGVWVHRVGVFGQTHRGQSLVQPRRFASKVQQERSRIASRRALTEVE